MRWTRDGAMLTRVPAAADLRPLLRRTALPGPLVDELLAGASPIWLMSGPAALLATDIALVHPPLVTGEVRAIAHPLRAPAQSVRVTVVAEDRWGLLADTAAAFTSEGSSVTDASAMTWTDRKLALHAVTVPAVGWDEERWDRFGRRLRGLAPLEPVYWARGDATVSATGHGMGRCLLTVEAPDQIGLLWAICRWLADREIGIEAAHVGGSGGRAGGTFLVVGAPDVAALTEYLGGGPVGAQ
jgi:glycine cleavage system regulatory protein